MVAISAEYLDLLQGKTAFANLATIMRRIAVWLEGGKMGRQ